MCRDVRILLGGIIISVGLMVSTLVVNASEEKMVARVEPVYEQIGTTSVILNVENRKATCCTKVSRKSGSSISVSMCLQKYKNGNWRRVKTWTGSSSLTNYVFTKSCEIQKGKYRVVSTIKVGTETVTKTSKIITS